MTQREEQRHILQRIEQGQITAEEGARLLEAAKPQPGARAAPRSLRVRVTDVSTQRQKVDVTIPVSLINVGRKLGARLVPRDEAIIGEILHSIERGVLGRIFDMQDLEEGERIEVFLE